MHCTLSYFVSDVHLGLEVGNPADREARFVNFLRSLPENTASLYMLGDIWDFWYEYRDVVPKGYVRVFSALMDLMDRGVRVYFFQGNHDVWTYHYFEELGMVRLVQPSIIDVDGTVFCLGHGDGLGEGVPFGYRFLRSLFHNRFAQSLFSALHPWIGFRFGKNWSRHNRLSRGEEYRFRGSDEPIYKFAVSLLSQQHIDYFIFGHFHVDVRETLSDGASLVILKDWIHCSPYAVFDSATGVLSTYGVL